MMLTEEARRRRIGRMMEAAKMYRGWSGTELARALGREPSRAVPATGNPKLDLIARLADALEWDAGEVADCLLGEEDAGHDELESLGFDELDARAQTAHRQGDFHALEAIARAMQRAAATGRQRATAANRLAGAHDGFGRYPRVLSCVQAGLAERNIGTELRTMLLVNLANANYTLWNLHEARAVSQSLVWRFEVNPPVGRIARVAQAFSYSILGHTRRRTLGRTESEDEFGDAAEEAELDLTRAERLFTELADEYGDDQYLGLASTARGGIIEVRSARGMVSADDALAEVLARLDGAVDPACTQPSILESLGWWGVFGANIAFRAGEAASQASEEEAGAELDRVIAVCTNKASEIAETLDLWAIRERAFTMEWFRRQQIGYSPQGEGLAWMLDADDVRVLVGTMGRFPRFRPTGWAILDRAELTESAA